MDPYNPYSASDIPLDILQKFIKEIDKKLSKEYEINEWVVNYVDIPKEKRAQPFKYIKSYRKKKFLVSENNSISVQEKSKEEIPEIVVHRTKETFPEKDIIIVVPKPVEDKIRKSKIDYESKTIVELKKIAKERGLYGYSKFRKNDLIDFLKTFEL
jgi:hypothetical protein